MSVLSTWCANMANTRSSSASMISLISNMETYGLQLRTQRRMNLKMRILRAFAPSCEKHFTGRREGTKEYAGACSHIFIAQCASQGHGYGLESMPPVQKKLRQ